MGEQEANDRGFLFRDIRMWIEQRFGSDGLKKIYSRISPESRSAIQNAVPHLWYPTSYVAEIYRAVHDEFKPKDHTVMVELGRFMADHSVKGFLRYLVQLISVETIIQRIERIWGKYHNSGSIEAEILKNDGSVKEGSLTVKGYDAGEYWCRLMTGYIESFIISTGVKDVKVEEQTCIHKGDGDCSWRIRWEE